MRVFSLHRAPGNAIRRGDILVTQDRVLARRDGAKHLTTSTICAGCAIQGDLCSRGGFLCGVKGYFVDIEPTEEIERARDLLALKGELE